MEHIIRNLLRMAVVLTALLPLRLHAERDTTVFLTVAHTNDTHSCIEPITKHYADPKRADKAGFVRRAAQVRDLRKLHPGLLLFDCGDFSQGSAYYNLFKGEVEVKLMNHMHYDACTIGNHEFDFGLENMKRLFELATFPVVCANYDFTGTVLEKVVKPYVVLERKGLRIGVFGLSPRLEGLVTKANCEGVTYNDPVETAGRTAKLLKLEERCDLIVCLSHLGWEIEGDNDRKVIENTRYIDVMLGGHTHTYLTEPEFVVNIDGQHVIYNQMGKNGQYIGVLELQMDPLPK